MTFFLLWTDYQNQKSVRKIKFVQQLWPTIPSDTGCRLRLKIMWVQSWISDVSTPSPGDRKHSYMLFLCVDLRVRKCFVTRQEATYMKKYFTGPQATLRQRRRNKVLRDISERPATFSSASNTRPIMVWISCERLACAGAPAKGATLLQ